MSLSRITIAYVHMGCHLVCRKKGLSRLPLKDMDNGLAKGLGVHNLHLDIPDLKQPAIPHLPAAFRVKGSPVKDADPFAGFTALARLTEEQFARLGDSSLSSLMACLYGRGSSCLDCGDLLSRQELFELPF
jgi:hypothetical protein